MSSSSPTPNRDILDELHKLHPAAPFVADPAVFVQEAGSLQNALAQLETNLRNFSALEKRYKDDRARKQAQMPDIVATLATLRMLNERAAQADAEPLRVQYELCDTLYAKASIKQTSHVFLWLGADTFVEYPVGEALELLEVQHTNVKKTIADLNIIVDYFKDQRNTSQVNIARIHNFGVEQRKRGLLK